jgi:hypothetical protein
MSASMYAKSPRLPCHDESPAARRSRCAATALGFLLNRLHAVWKTVCGYGELFIASNQRFCERRFESPEDVQNLKQGVRSQ